MIEPMDDTPWQPGQWARYDACSTHAGALSRMNDFDRELDVAEACEHCRVQYRITERTA